MPTRKDTPKYHHTQSPLGGGPKAVVLSLSLVAFLGLCYLLKGILTSLFLAFTVAYIFDPVVDFIESRQVILPTLRVPRAMAVAILITSAFLLGLGFMAYAIPRTVNSAKQVASALEKKYPHYKKQLEGLVGEYGQVALLALLEGKEKQREVPVTKEGLPSDLKEEGPPPSPLLKKVLPLGMVAHLRQYAPEALQYMLNVIKNLFYSTFGLVGTMANLLTFTFVSIYLLKDYDHVVNEVKALIPPSRKDKVLELMARVDTNLRGFLRGQMTVALILGLFYGLALSLVGVPMAFFVGFLAGIGNMVPLLGTIMGLLLAMTLTALEHGGEFWPFAFVGIIFAIGQFLDGTILTPRIVGSKVGLHPVVIILSVLIWGQLLGLLGLLMAVPATSAAMVFVGEALREYKERMLRG
jgi:predicted PurR-regulated permease PerM